MEREKVLKQCENKSFRFESDLVNWKLKWNINPSWEINRNTSGGCCLKISNLVTKMSFSLEKNSKINKREGWRKERGGGGWSLLMRARAGGGRGETEIFSPKISPHVIKKGRGRRCAYSEPESTYLGTFILVSSGLED